MDTVEKMVSGIKSLATPLQDLILHEAITDREYANKAAKELADKDAALERITYERDLSAKAFSNEEKNADELRGELAEARKRIAELEEQINHEK